MSIRAIPLLLLFTLMGCSSFHTTQNPGMQRYSLEVGGEARSYWLYDPAPDEVKPLVILFHGSMGSGYGMSNSIDLNRAAEREGFAVAYPDAPAGNWAEGCGCNNADRLQIPDLEFVDRIVADVSGKTAIDAQRLFAVGFSQGGLFAGRLACERSDLFTGVMIVAASMSVPLSQRCEPSQPVAVTIIQGKLDGVLPYNGTDDGALSLLSAPATAAFWAEKNGLTSPPEISYAPSEQNAMVETRSYLASPLTSPRTVTLHSLLHAGHVWPLGGHADANAKIVEMVQMRR